MKIQTEIPTRAQILSGGFVYTIGPRGGAAAQGDLGDYKTKNGAYILHANGQIRYIGRTTPGERGIFGDRHYGHFCESADGRHPRLHRLLAGVASAGHPIHGYLLDLDDLAMMVDAGSAKLSDAGKAFIMEQVLICIFNPPFNRDKADDNDDSEN